MNLHLAKYSEIYLHLAIVTGWSLEKQRMRPMRLGFGKGYYSAILREILMQKDSD
jgi:hypothetical protein